jgi:hypothetical protein
MLTRSRPAVFFSFMAALLGALVSLSTHEKEAQAAERLSLGEVSTSVTREGVDMPGLLRALATEELRAVEASKAPRHKGAIVSVALVRMDSESSAKGSASTCFVSVVLRDPRRGVLIALLNGRARAEDGARAATSVERSAMQASLRSALSRIPEALAH